MQQEKIQKLRIQVGELLRWKSENSSEQISYPMGDKTKKIIKDGLIFVTGKTQNIILFDGGLEIMIDGKIYWVVVKNN